LLLCNNFHRGIGCSTRRLRNRGKCNRRGEIRGNVGRDVAVRLNWFHLLRASPSRGGGVLRVILPNVTFGLWLYWA